ncbi:cysteine beta-synthase [Candidatus Protochlamydia naegleriophila]|uniref:Cysteine beta-synthase n=1 Tax=Candidatus Protochlamydia naegleriophila TaxID=389348 RepID=A0A0U5J9M9_9BACT|nr:pyridoxal-phosphate dependent enzyme [Candidatus Protochlamydia naegleriophila]CUI16142.1 cysteine beta-synthase [Candidatus Protochlamydia naegleriophila]
MALNDILAAIGKTPSVRLHRVGRELDCELYGKCEFLNPGGSIKDRIAYQMIEAAEKSGRIKPGDTLIEASSGNTGIGFAMVGAVKGYRIIITMPAKMSREKEVIIEALGAKIYRTPTEAAWDAPDSHISLAKRLEKELPNAHFLDQYSNPNNPAAHFEATAEEIINDMGEQLAMVVIGVGTGGTVTGVAKKIKAKMPHVKIVGIDPYGSILGGGTEVHSYQVEGIGYDFIPKVLDNSLVDEYVKVGDEDSFLMARRLIQEEGLLVGGSSGSAVWGALQVAKKLGAGQKCLVILPDGIRNYLSKFVDNKWMQDHGFMNKGTEA